MSVHPALEAARILQLSARAMLRRNPRSHQCREIVIKCNTNVHTILDQSRRFVAS